MNALRCLAKTSHLDERYRERYGMSMVENLKLLKAKGMEAFLRIKQKSTRAQAAETWFAFMTENATACDYIGKLCRSTAREAINPNKGKWYALSS